MRQASWSESHVTCAQTDLERSHEADLRRVAFGAMPLGEAFQTLAYGQEEQARVGAELLEREIWAVTAILAASAPIWRQRAQPTLCFAVQSRLEPVTFHLEVGTFAHLAALDNPSPGEQELIAATGPCWARVYPHHDRQLAGQIGALACSYMRMPVAEAVAILGLETILDHLEAATRATGRAVLDQAAVQARRQAQVLKAEQVLGWGAELPAEARTRTTPLLTRLALALVGEVRQERLVLGTAYLGLLAILLCLLGILPELLTALTLAGVCLAIWAYRTSR
jgi:hypothetical protein